MDRFFRVFQKIFFIQRLFSTYQHFVATLFIFSTLSPRAHTTNMFIFVDPIGRSTPSRMTYVIKSFSTEGRADSTWQVDAFGVRNFGSTMPECKHSVAAFALYAFVALVRMIPEWGGSKMTFLIPITTSGRSSRDGCLPRSPTGRV